MRVLEEIEMDKVRVEDQGIEICQHDCTIIGTIRIDHISKVIEKGDIFPHPFLTKMGSIVNKCGG